MINPVTRTHAVNTYQQHMEQSKLASIYGGTQKPLVPIRLAPPKQKKIEHRGQRIDIRI